MKIIGTTGEGYNKRYLVEVTPSEMGTLTGQDCGSDYGEMKLKTGSIIPVRDNWNQLQGILGIDAKRAEIATQLRSMADIVSAVIVPVQPPPAPKDDGGDGQS